MNRLRIVQNADCLLSFLLTSLRCWRDLSTKCPEYFSDIAYWTHPALKIECFQINLSTAKRTEVYIAHKYILCRRKKHYRFTSYVGIHDCCVAPDTATNTITEIWAALAVDLGVNVSVVVYSCCKPQRSEVKTGWRHLTLFTTRLTKIYGDLRLTNSTAAYGGG